jgi:hypothetical protein
VRLTQLPESWKSGERLDILAHLSVGIDQIANAAGYDVMVDATVFPAFKYVDLLMDDQIPVALAEYEGIPSCTYVRMSTSTTDPLQLIRSLLSEWRLDDAVIAWDITCEE